MSLLARSETGRSVDISELVLDPSDAVSAQRLGAFANQNVARIGSLRKRALQVPCSAVGPLFAAIDAITIIVASLLGAEGYQFFVSGASWNLHFHVGAGVMAALIYVLIGKSSQFYEVADIISVERDSSRVLWQWLWTSLLLTMLAFLFRIGIDFSRGSIVCFAVLALVSMLASRTLLKVSLAWALRTGRVQGRRVVLVGLQDELAAVRQDDLLRRFGLTELERVILPQRKGEKGAPRNAVLLKLEQALAVARDHRADEIVLALDWSDTPNIELILDRLRSSPLAVQLLPDQKVSSLIGNPAFSVTPSLSIEIQRPPLSQLEQFGKRVVDIVGASLAIVFLAPLMLITALTIKLESPGPVLFRQQRSGFNAKRFQILKFRSMMVMEDGDRVTQAVRNDSRVTKFGRILRSSSIDELPQLFNVLLGDMSLVGPRPHAVAHDDQYGQIIADYAYRHHVKPGITGWAQVHGFRGGTGEVALMKKRLDLDIWYICNWNIGLDALILLRTVVEVFRHRNAY
jgi:Undecaprenyl-phosphate glucose phosphotransferase